MRHGSAKLLFFGALLASTATIGSAFQRDENGLARGGPSPTQNLATPDQQLAETEAAMTSNVSMRCGTADAGHRVTIWASNSGSTARSCRSTCYYRTSSGQNGTLSGSGTVPARASNVVFLSHYNSGITFTVTNPGSFSCS